MSKRSQNYDLSHLAPAIRPRALEPNVERISRIRSDWVVRHDSVKKVLNHARWLIEGPKCVRTEGLLVTGAVGAGKSTIGALIERHYRRPDSKNVPIVSISMTGARHMRTVYGRIIDALDGLVKANHTTPDREMTVQRLLTSVGARALIIDEVQDIVAESIADQKHALKAIKYITTKVQIPVIALGTEPAEKAFATDEHMASRIKRHVLPAWAEGDELTALLYGVSRIVPLRRPSAMHSEAFVRELLDLTGGSMKEMMSIIRIAAINAVLSGTEYIDVGDLRNALLIPDMDQMDEFLVEEDSTC
ncbi:MAG: TniB family NTP-binding protein [Luteibacter sp.]